MTSILKVDSIQNAAGTSAAEIKSDGTFYPAGGIVQVQQTVLSGRQNITATTETDVTGSSVSITPKSSTSKIMVFSSIPSIASNNNTIRLALYRDSTIVNELGHYSTISFWSPFSINFQYLDSPSTTSSITYKIAVQFQTSGMGMWVNYANTYAGFSAIGDARGTVTLMEIAQ